MSQIQVAIGGSSKSSNLLEVSKPLVIIPASLPPKATCITTLNRFSPLSQSSLKCGITLTLDFMVLFKLQWHVVSVENKLIVF